MTTEFLFNGNAREIHYIAIPKLIDVAKDNTPESLKSKNAIETIKWILGGERRSEAIKILDEKVQKELNPLRANNLKAVADILRAEIEKVDKIMQETDYKTNDSNVKVRKPD